jgi:hypothetical protein
VVHVERLALAEPQPELPGLRAQPQAVLAPVVVELRIVAPGGDEVGVQPAEAAAAGAGQGGRHHPPLVCGRDGHRRLAPAAKLDEVSVRLQQRQVRGVVVLGHEGASFVVPIFRSL